jgi:hypothetical protein
MSMIQAYRPGVPGTTFENMTAGAASSASTALAPAGTILRVKAVDQPIRLVVGPGTPVATASSLYLSAGETEYYLVHPNDRVAVIRAGAVDGAVNIAFLGR